MQKIATMLLILLSTGFAQQSNHIRIEDDSDWWSLSKDDTLGRGLKPQEKLLDAADLTIAGIRLGNDSDDPRKRFGPATEVERGDAAVGRTQVCYRSEKDNIFLIFEWGEVDSAAYLFKSGKGWNGQDKCTLSKLVTAQTSTARGLRLGSSTDDVIRILGKPTRRTPGSLVYFFEADKKNSPEEINKLSREYKEANGRDGNPKDFEHYSVTSFIEAHFEQLKLTYLAVDTSETY